MVLFNQLDVWFTAVHRLLTCMCKVLFWDRCVIMAAVKGICGL